MALILDDEQKMLRDSAAEFLAGSAPMAHLRQLRDSHDAQGYSPALWSSFAQQGYSAMLVPEAHGGLGLGVVEAGLVSEQLGRTLTPSPFLSTAVLSAWLLAQAGSAAQQARWLPAIATATANSVLALAVDETSKHNPNMLDTTATDHAGGYLLNGSKTLVLDGHVAQALIVSARHAASGATLLLLVPADTAGVQIERTVMVDAHNAARVQFKDVQLSADAIMGTAESGAALLDQVLDVGRAVVAAQLLGIADEVFARTINYLKERRQFDRIIGEFQALQHRAAELYCDIELTRAIVLKALQAVAATPAQAALLVSQAKARACTTANRAVQEGVQMHGGMGMTDAFDLGLFMKRARVLQELFGDAGFHAGRAAVLSGY